MRAMISGVLILILWGAVPALAQLPPEIQADAYLLRAEQAIGEGDQARARAEIDKIILLQKEYELDLADEFHFRYAQVASAADLPEQAQEAVMKYLTLAGREGKHYRESLELMNQAQDAIEASKEPWEASNEPTPQAQQAKQVLVETQVDAGGSPEGQEEKQSLFNADETIEVQAVPDCTKWNTAGYFSAATVKSVTACLAAGSGPMMRDRWESTPLHTAAKWEKNPAVFEALIEAGADPMARDDDKNTPLHYAAMHNENPAVTETLLKAGADLAARNGSQSTSLHYAAMHNENPAVTETLLKAGADLAARNEDGRTPLYYAKEYNNNPAVRQVLLAAGAGQVERQLTAAKPRRKAKSRSGPGFLDAAIGIIGGTAIAAAGGGTEEALEAGAVFAGGVIGAASPRGSAAGVPAAASTGNVDVRTGDGSCGIPGYPRPPGGVANLGLAWCPSNVDFQVRAFALQAAGAQCAIATGSSSTPAQIQARRREISAACGRLAALGAPDCQCSPGVGGSGFSQDSSAIDREQQRREQQARRQEAARQAALAEKRRIEAANAAVLNSDCSCIRIEDDGEYACLDGFVVGNNASGKPLCDIKR